MTRKDAVQTELNLYNIVIGTVIIGAMVGLGVYNLQTSSINFISVIGAVLILGIVAVFLRRKYEKLLDELRGLP